MANKRVSVLAESSTGRNLKFKDNHNKNIMSRSKFVEEIEKGNYDDYHIRVINKIKTPASNPDETKKDNLG